jgi:hypothetical protein
VWLLAGRQQPAVYVRCEAVGEKAVGVCVETNKVSAVPLPSVLTEECCVRDSSCQCGPRGGVVVQGVEVCSNARPLLRAAWCAAVHCLQGLTSCVALTPLRGWQVCGSVPPNSLLVCGSVPHNILLVCGVWLCATRQPASGWCVALCHTTDC